MYRSSVRSTMLCLTLILFAVTLRVSATEQSIQKYSADGIAVSLITILPGQPLYSSFGHTAIRVVNTESREDILYNYGLSVYPFNLRFLGKMLIGKMDFMVDALKTDETLRFYRGVENRTIIEQVLNLESKQVENIVATLEHDVRLENSVYNYRYFTDNCTTKVWEILSPFIADVNVTAIPSSRPTLRGSIREAIGEKTWLRLLIDLLLGFPADRPLAPNVQPFLPLQLMEKVERSSVKLTVGQQNFVLSSQVLYKASKQSLLPLQIQPIIFSVVLLGLSLCLSLIPSTLLAQIFDAFLFGATAIAGLCILLFGIVAGYREVGMNLNLLWANPLAVFALVALRRGLYRRASAIIVQIFTYSAGLFALVGGVGIQTLPLEFRIIALAIAIRSISLYRHTLPVSKTYQRRY
ncbi:MAG: DUF4105 domain-containing protein [Rectinemataceae bacterium]|nr:DUF4105 domain-containing protein [Rectinemataceae bacterium]